MPGNRKGAFSTILLHLRLTCVTFTVVRLLHLALNYITFTIVNRGEWLGRAARLFEVGYCSPFWVVT